MLDYVCPIAEYFPANPSTKRIALELSKVSTTMLCMVTYFKTKVHRIEWDPATGFRQFLYTYGQYKDDLPVRWFLSLCVVFLSILKLSYYFATNRTREEVNSFDVTTCTMSSVRELLTTLFGHHDKIIYMTTESMTVGIWGLMYFYNGVVAPVLDSMPEGPLEAAIHQLLKTFLERYSIRLQTYAKVGLALSTHFGADLFFLCRRDEQTLNERGRDRRMQRTKCGRRRTRTIGV